MNKGFLHRCLSGYVGGGAGISFISNDIDISGVGSIDDEDEAFTYQIFAGGSYHISDGIHVSFGARYLDAKDADFGGFDFTVLGTLAADLRLRFSF